MRLTLGKLALAAVLAGTVLTGTTASAQNTQSDTRVNVKFQDADLYAVTKQLTDMTGVQFVFEHADDEKLMSKPITLVLNNQTVEDVLRYACQSAGAYFRRDENGVYVISFKKPEVVTPPTKNNNTLPTVKAPVKMFRFKLLKADAEHVLFQMKFPDQAWDFNKPFKDMKEFESITKPNSGWESSRILVPAFNPNNPNNYQNTFQPISSSAATPRLGADGSNDISLPGDGANQGGFGGGAGGAGQGGGQGGGQGQGGQLTPGGLIPDGIDYITFDPVTNSIVVRATDEQIRELQDAISFFDVAPRQVQVKVEFVTTSTSQARSLGFDWLFSRGGVFAGNLPGTFARSTDPIFLNFATGNFTMRLRTLLQEGQGRVVNAPVLRTLNNQGAVVTQSNQTTIFISQLVSIGNGNVITQAIPVPVTVQTQLAVRPRINDDGTITMALAPTISDFGQFRRGPQGQEVPDVLSQQISVVARVRDGETIALSGLTRKSETGSTARLPILSDLPIIGQFFRGSSRDVNFTELLVFVTPTIIPDEEIDGIGP